jgi:hypothetical protein
MVLVRQARQSGTFSGVFCNFHFCAEFAAPWRKLTGGCEYILSDSGDFGQGLKVYRVWVQSGLWCLYGGRAKTGRTGVLLHQVCKVCIWHTQCTLCNQLVEKNAYFMQTMQTLGEDSKYAH